jgi:hypothetical protein
MQHAFLAAEAALFFALTSDGANDKQPPPRPGVRPLQRAQAARACCSAPAHAAQSRAANYSPADAMSPCVSVSHAM